MQASGAEADELQAGPASVRNTDAARPRVNQRHLLSFHSRRRVHEDTALLFSVLLCLCRVSTAHTAYPRRMLVLVHRCSESVWRAAASHARCRRRLPFMC
jgi:hypothetical protein